MSPPKFLRDLDTLIRARYPLLYLVTWEEQRVDALMISVAQSHGKDLYEWSATRGLKPMEGTKGSKVEELKEPLDALQAIVRAAQPVAGAAEGLSPLHGRPEAGARRCASCPSS